MLRHLIRELERIAKYLGAAWVPNSAGVKEYGNESLDSSLRQHQEIKSIRKSLKPRSMLLAVMELASRTRNGEIRILPIF